ncbi:hypothetical protein THASP1DRAFT_30203 [Thamnocephalis sphaerospora]|uniref:Major facilitator superfamily domain-containing protein n=1 Tax=Thamnocephalis sphaerospora TaxID=78915 RepID=A0A4P9XPP4_9FUNG|nr:hypothetical protein THASP1DRAFT_30203 [Thamnocephalis sphaerospora]|eukprot:RKP07984.1 hypothetical protein THASP1DRAFT_30203 [Thamnocephalis sphaerospora]
MAVSATVAKTAPLSVRGLLLGTMWMLASLSTTTFAQIQNYFVNAETGVIDMGRFTRTVAFICACVHSLAAIGMWFSSTAEEPARPDELEAADAIADGSDAEEDISAAEHILLPISEKDAASDTSTASQLALNKQIVLEPVFMLLWWAAFIFWGVDYTYTSNVPRVARKILRAHAPWSSNETLQDAERLQLQLVSISCSVSYLVFGPLSDHIAKRLAKGHYLCLAIPSFCYTFAYLLGMFAHSITTLSIVSFLMGIGGSGFTLAIAIFCCESWGVQFYGVAV